MKSYFSVGKKHFSILTKIKNFFTGTANLLNAPSYINKQEFTLYDQNFDPEKLMTKEVKKALPKQIESIYFNK